MALLFVEKSRTLSGNVVNVSGNPVRARCQGSDEDRATDDSEQSVNSAIQHHILILYSDSAKFKSYSVLFAYNM